MALTQPAIAQTVLAVTGQETYTGSGLYYLDLPIGGFSWVSISNSPGTNVAFHAWLVHDDPMIQYDVGLMSNRYGLMAPRVRSNSPGGFTGWINVNTTNKNVITEPFSQIRKDPATMPDPTSLILLAEVSSPGFSEFNLMSSLSQTGWAGFAAETNGASTGIWKGDLTPVVVAGQGGAAPGIPDRYIGPVSRAPAINALNYTAFGTHLQDAGQTLVGSAVFKETPTGVVSVAWTGKPAPGTATTFANIGLGDLQGDVGFNNAGETTFYATLSDERNGVWKEKLISPNTYELVAVALRDAVAPGTGGLTFSGDVNGGDDESFTIPLINGAGKTVFQASIAGGVNDGIWTEALGIGTPGGETGQLKLVARTGMVAPGSGGVTFSTFGAQWPLGDIGWGASINDQGRVAFVAILSDGTSGIWATDSQGIVQPIVMSGQTLQVGGEDYSVGGVGVATNVYRSGGGGRARNIFQ